MKRIKKKMNFYFLDKDLEFLIISELSNISTGIKYVRNEIEADKILFILIGTDFAYVSLLLKRVKRSCHLNF